MFRKIEIPFWLKIIAGFIALALFFGIYFTLSSKENKNKREFFKEELATVVVNSRPYQGRSVEFLLESGLKVYFMPPIDSKIMIGDSLKKEKNSYKYKIYRKNINGTFTLFANYDFEHIE